MVSDSGGDVERRPIGLTSSGWVIVHAAHASRNIGSTTRCCLEPIHEDRVSSSHSPIFVTTTRCGVSSRGESDLGTITARDLSGHHRGMKERGRALATSAISITTSRVSLGQGIKDRVSTSS